MAPLDPAETPQRFDQQFRRFVVRGHVDRDKRFTAALPPLGKDDTRESRGNQLKAEHEQMPEKIGDHHARMQSRENQQQSRRSKTVRAQDQPMGHAIIPDGIHLNFPAPANTANRASKTAGLPSRREMAKYNRRTAHYVNYSFCFFAVMLCRSADAEGTSKADRVLFLIQGGPLLPFPYGDHLLVARISP